MKEINTDRSEGRALLESWFYSVIEQRRLIDLADQSLSLRAVPGTLIYMALFTANVLMHSYHLVHPVLISTAGALLLALGIFRMALVVWFRQLHDWNSGYWRGLFAGGTLGVAIVWSFTWSIAILTNGLVPTTNLSLMMTIGITAAGVSTLAPCRKLVMAYLVLMFIPAPAAVFIHGVEGRMILLFLFMLGGPFLASVGLRLNKEFWQGLRSKVLLEQRAEELAVARDLARESDRAKSLFLAKMSHEIRTPMNGVMGMTELLLNSDLNERQQYFARSAYRSSESLLTVIDDIFDFSKIEAGKLKLDHQAFDLRILLEDQIDLFAESAHRKSLELTCLVPTGLATAVIGDENRLRQILTNLLGNALKFTEQGEVSLRVYQGNVSSDRAEYRFEVEDTGIGISEEAKHHVFESFSQADDTASRRYGGTGLGLAIARQLCHLMGGEIGLVSQPGVGTTFRFSVDLKVQTESAGKVSLHVPPIESQRILVLDHCINSRKVIEDMLSVFEVELVFAADDQELNGLLEQGAQSGTPYDTVIINSDLSDGSTGRLVDRIRAGAPASLKQLLVLLPVTGEYPAALAAGLKSNGFLRKPLRRESLYGLLGQSLQESPVLKVKPAENSPVSQEHHAVDSLPVLLVEDNPVNQEVAEAILDLLGYSVEIACNGQEACQMVAARTYAMILMDCQMPVMDGYQATVRIREMEKNGEISRLPVVALTANTLKGDREKALEAGMDDYLGKPFNQFQLQQLLSRWIGSVPNLSAKAVS
ncbi:MAG: response regulator [Gammaproteobacteria bacterium]|nr:response regulator [Gammaproteobacteria bacterium]